MKPALTKRLPIEVTLLGGFVLTLLIILMVSFFTYRSLTVSIESEEWVIHTQDVLKNLGGLRSNLWMVLSNYRGTVIFGDEQFDQQLQVNISTVQQQVQQLRQLTHDNIPQQQRVNTLQPLVDQFLAFGNQVINVRKMQGLAAAGDLIKSKQGMFFLESSLQIISSMENMENGLLQQRIMIDKRNNTAVYYSLLAGFLLQLMVLTSLYYFFWRNLTRRKKVEKNLLDSQKRFQIVTRATNDTIWDWNILNDTFWFNENIHHVFGYPLDQTGSRVGWWHEHVHKDDAKEAYASLSSAIAGGQQTWSAEYRFQRNDGTYADVLDRGYVLHDEAGNPVRMIGSMMDITERKKVERLKIEFISTVSHELRTPLTSIRGSLGLILGDAVGKMPEKAKQLLDIAYNNCERLIRLINDILDIEKYEAGKMIFIKKTCEISSLVREAILANQSYVEKYHVTLRQEPSLPFIVHVDYDRIMQVLANLISNAAKFSPSGGEIIISITQQQQMVRVSVSDQGKGISKEFQTKIFQKFAQADSSSTRASGGTGLGLSISRIIVEKMGGTLEFSTKENQGSIFYFDLPIYQTVETAVSSAVIPTTIATKTASQVKTPVPSILICEDDKDFAELLSIILNQGGFQADVAYTAAQAKECLAKKAYDAMTLDLVLPDQNGIAFIKELRKSTTNSSLPVIVISGKAQEGQKELLNGDAVAVMDWLNKPIDSNSLIAAIQRIKDKLVVNPRILHVDDDVDILQIVATVLEGTAQLTSAMSLKEAREKLAEQQFDLVILDLALPDGSGIDLLPILAERIIPVVVFSIHNLEKEYANYVSKVLIKSQSSNQDLLNTVAALMPTKNKMDKTTQRDIKHD